MLRLTHKAGDKIILTDGDNNQIGTIKIEDVQNGQVKLAIENDQSHLKVYREKMWLSMGKNNED